MKAWSFQWMKSYVLPFFYFLFFNLPTKRDPIFSPYFIRLSDEKVSCRCAMCSYNLIFGVSWVLWQRIFLPNFKKLYLIKFCVLLIVWLDCQWPHWNMLMWSGHCFTILFTLAFIIIHGLSVNMRNVNEHQLVTFCKVFILF